MKGHECGRRVLVCDDERHIVRLIQVNLERQGIEVVATFTGTEALARIDASFEIAVIDLGLPDMSGREVIRRIKQSPDTSNVRLILMGPSENGGRGSDSGGDDESGEPDLYLTKPFDPMLLVSA